MKFLPKYFTKMYKFWIKTVVLYPKMYIWSRKPKKNCTFYSKNEVFAKKFHQNVQNIFYYFFLIFCSRISVKISNISRNYQNYLFFYFFFAFFMKIVGFWTVFIADMNSACKNIPRSIFLQNLQIMHNYLQFYHRL